MTRAEKLEALQAWQQAIQESNEFLSVIDKAMGLSVESPIRAAVWSLQHALRAATSRVVGDEWEWLDWYALENDFGNRGLEAGAKGALKPIRSLDDLLSLIGGHE
jgi:hypothetical protein